LTALLGAQQLASIFAADAGADIPTPIAATVVATGIPGAGAITQVGTFHKGGPFAPGGALATASHPVLDRTRLLVASSSKFRRSVADTVADTARSAWIDSVTRRVRRRRHCAG
jgi:hypothetical protein